MPKKLNADPPKRSTQANSKGLAGLDLIRVERGIGDVRAGLPVLVSGDSQSAIIIATEALEPPRLVEMNKAAVGLTPWLIMTPARAAALKIRVYTADAVAIPLPDQLDSLAAIKSLADPARDLENPMRGPFHARREPLPEAAIAALSLLKHAGLMPSAIAWLTSTSQGQKIAKKLDLLSVSTTAAINYLPNTARGMSIVAQAELPLLGAEKTRILAFRAASGAREHLALLIGTPSPDNPILVRVHSECFTGDLLGSLKCDCGDQLRGAIQRMGDDATGGVLLYLAQEGRGIGLVNKLRAYSLQDQGFDTIDANTRLGFQADERDFAVAAEILKHLGFNRIKLLTNNPEKVDGLTREGINVIERVPHTFRSNPHNVGYLAAKAKKSGHIF